MSIYMLVVYIVVTLIFCIGIHLFFSTNTVYTLLGFLALVIMLAGLLVLLGAEFFAILLVLIYVGVVMVFFMFTLMLVNMRFEPYVMESRPLVMYVFATFHVWLSLIFITAGEDSFSNLEDLTLISKADVDKPWMDALVSQLDVENIGLMLYCKYGFLCFVLGLILLSVLIGCLTMIEMLKQHEKLRLISAALQKRREEELRWVAEEKLYSRKSTVVIAGFAARNGKA